MTTKYKLQIIITLMAAAMVISAIWILNKSEAGAASQSTDDAYVRADFTVIAPQVSGVITTVSVDDNQQVEQGAPLFQIDDRELMVARENAQANIDSLNAQLERQQSLIAQANAAVAASSANLKLAERNHQRFINLARDGSGTVRDQQQAEAEWGVQRAAYDRDRAGLRAAEQQVKILHAELDKARAAKADADLRLSYTQVAAPITGTVAQRHARVGGYAHVGEPQLTLVPLDKIYIEANFRETQLARIQVGQTVDITVDALPDVHLTGHVDSVGPASGTSFSLVPPHNATGNFTKIVQRLPVRIRLDKEQKGVMRLRVGMSVTPTVHVADSPSTSL